MSRARKPFVYMTVIAVAFGIVGLLIMEQQFSGNTVLKSDGTIELNEVASHNTKNDCWIVVNNYVYDITLAIHSYPQFSNLGEYCGKDANSAFADMLDELKTNFESYKVGLLKA